MKHFITIAFLFLFCLSTVNAQKSHERIMQQPYNEISVSYGDAGPIIVFTAFLDALGLALTSPIWVITGETMQLDKITTTGAFSGEYLRRVGRVRLGVDYTYLETNNKYILSSNSTSSTSTSETRNRYYMIMPTCNVTYGAWKWGEVFGAYSAGASFNKSISDDDTSEESNSCSFVFQMTPIALRVGGEHLGAFIGLGCGCKGFFTAGLSCRF